MKLVDLQPAFELAEERKRLLKRIERAASYDELDYFNALLAEVDKKLAVLGVEIGG